MIWEYSIRIYAMTEALEESRPAVSGRYSDVVRGVLRVRASSCTEDSTFSRERH